MGCIEYWRGLHVDLHHTHTTFAGGRGRHKRVAMLATPSWLRRRARLPGKAGRQGAVAGRVRWRAGCGGGPGRVAGRVGWRAGRGGWPGRVEGRVVGGGWIFGVKNVLEYTGIYVEYSSTYVEYSTLRRKSAFLRRIKISSCHLIP